MLFSVLIAQQPTSDAPSWFPAMPWVLIIVAFLFIFILPMRRQEKQRQTLMASLKKNAKIHNSGGIIGIVETIKENEDEVILRGGLRITKSSIVKIFATDEPAKDPKAGGA